MDIMLQNIIDNGQQGWTSKLRLLGGYLLIIESVAHISPEKYAYQATAYTKNCFLTYS